MEQQHPLINIIAPAGKIHATSDITCIQDLLHSWGYATVFGKSMLSGGHAFLSNTTELRFQDLKQALYDTNSQIIWCYRGGTGSAELLPLLSTLTPPLQTKIFLGFSDITALHIFFNQQWHWPTFHGPSVKQCLTDALSQQSVYRLFQSVQRHPLTHPKIADLYDFQPVNQLAKAIKAVAGTITGGNLTVIAHSLGTPFQLATAGKILLLEDTHEPAYKIRRMLHQLLQANIFKHITALLLGQFFLETTTDTEITRELNEFSNAQAFPVFKTNKIGHGLPNLVLPLGQTVKFSVK